MYKYVNNMKIFIFYIWVFMNNWIWDENEVWNYLYVIKKLLLNLIFGELIKVD